MGRVVGATGAMGAMGAMMRMAMSFVRVCTWIWEKSTPGSGVRCEDVCFVLFLGDVPFVVMCRSW
jgi:hypothetical protein